MKILLPVDGSEHALHAVHHALACVRAGLAAEFVLVNVQAPASLYEVMVAHDTEVIDEVRKAAGADLLRPAWALIEAAGLGYESEVVGGRPEHLIAEIAENYGCDAVIMGALGMGAAPDAFTGLGSVAREVLETCPLPVTVVRPPAPAEAAPDDEADAAAGSNDTA